MIDTGCCISTRHTNLNEIGLNIPEYSSNPIPKETDEQHAVVLNKSIRTPHPRKLTIMQVPLSAKKYHKFLTWRSFAQHVLRNPPQDTILDLFLSTLKLLKTATEVLQKAFAAVILMMRFCHTSES